MTKVSFLIIISFFLTNNLTFGQKQKHSSRYANQHKLSTGLTVVVAEGDFEPRSIGSYSIRIYDVNHDFPTDKFLYGTIRPRVGIIEQVRIKDINKDGTEEIIVIIRSVGTGGNLSADAFQYQSKQLKLIANVSGLEKKTDPIKALIKVISI